MEVAAAREEQEEGGSAWDATYGRAIAKGGAAVRCAVVGAGSQSSGRAGLGTACLREAMKPPCWK